MDTEISSVNTSFVGVVFPCITGVTDKESYKAPERIYLLYAGEHLRKMKSEKEHNEKRRVP